MLTYKGYIGRVEYDEDRKNLVGEIVGICSPIEFEGKTPKQIEKSFKQTINSYLSNCKKEGTEPEKPSLDFVPYEFLQNDVSVLMDKFEDVNDLIVTVNEKPFVLMIPLLGDETIGHLLAMISGYRGNIFFRAMQREARRIFRASNLTDEQVEDIALKRLRNCREAEYKWIGPEGDEIDS